MKKILLVFLFIVLYNYCMAQDAMRFRIYQSAYSYPGKKTAIEWNDVEIVGLLNIPKNKFQVYARTHLDYDLLEKDGDWIDDRGHHWMTCMAIDKDGVKCKVKFEMFYNESTGHVATVYVEYKDLTLMYRMQKDNGD